VFRHIVLNNKDGTIRENGGEELIQEQEEYKVQNYVGENP
jgi:hypothetical protein